MEDIEEYKDISIEEIVTSNSGEKEEENIEENKIDNIEEKNQTVLMQDDMLVSDIVEENASNMNVLIITISICVFLGLVLGIIFGRKSAK